MKSMLNVNLHLKYFHLLLHVVCLGKTSDSQYKFPGPFLMAKILQWWNIHSLCWVWNMECLILCKLRKLWKLFSTVKLKLGPNFSQFIQKLNVGLRLYFQVFLNSHTDFEVFECYSIWDSDGKCLNISLGCSFKFFPIY